MVEVYKNFLSIEECNILNNIAFQGVKEGWVNKGIDNFKFGYELRYTSRIHMKNAEYPKEVIEFSNRVRKFMNIDNYPIIEGHGKNGVVVSVIFKDGDVYEHKDPRSSDGLGTYRCNIVTQKNEDGAELYVNGVKIELNPGDLHCYWASESSHYVSKANGSTPRILWMFGAHLPLNLMKK